MIDLKSRWLRIAAVLLLLALLSAWALSLDSDDRTRLLGEGGPIEVATAILYAVCVVWVVARGGLSYAKSVWIPLAFTVLLGLRELDFDKRFTTTGLFKTEFFASHRVPIAEKLVGLLVIVGLVWLLTLLFRRHVRIRGEFRAMKEHPELVAAVAVLLLGSGLDGIGRKLSGIGIHLTAAQSKAAGSLEEVFELGIPIFLALAFTANLSDRSKATAGQPESEEPGLQ